MENKELEIIAKEDYCVKTNKKIEQVSYYEQKMSQFGVSSIDRFLKYCPNPSKNMQLGLTFAHKDFEIIAEAIANKKPWAVVSGLNPSGPLHFGHKLIFDELLWMQKNGADIYIPLTNDESYVVGKSPSLAAARKVAYEQVIPSIIAMGFDYKKTHIFVDSDYPQIYNLAMDLSTKLTLNKSFKVFGFDSKNEKENSGTVFYRSAVQIAQILLPQYPEFGGPKPVVIPVGIDQHPYILLARDIAERKGFIPPAELIIKFLPSLLGPENKMSASVSNSSIFLTDSVKVAEEKVKKAYTGGSVSAEFQREHGGVPEVCPIYLLQKYHFMSEKEANELYGECKGGKILCGRCKERCSEYVKEFLEEHQEKMRKVEKDIDKFILKKEIKSILE
jgi:tryptophanyl-tRNA synthetase